VLVSQVDDSDSRPGGAQLLRLRLGEGLAASVIDAVLYALDEHVLVDQVVARGVVARLVRHQHRRLHDVVELCVLSLARDRRTRSQIVPKFLKALGGLAHWLLSGQ